jgi:hypothetical protein
VRSFAEWKAVSMAQLMALRRKHQGRPEVLRELENLISRIRYASPESLPTVLAAVEKLLPAVPELEAIVPEAEEVEAWRRARQRGKTPSGSSPAPQAPARDEARGGCAGVANPAPGVLHGEGA